MRRSYGRDHGRGSITGGIILITIGVLFLLSQLGLASIHGLWRYWPLVLVVTGTVKLLTGQPGRGQGVGELLLGLVFLAISFHWQGLDWDNGWPLILIAVGLGLTVRALWPKPPAEMGREPSGAVVVEDPRHD